MLQKQEILRKLLNTFLNSAKFAVLKKMQKMAIDNYLENGTWDKVCKKIIGFVAESA